MRTALTCMLTAACLTTAAAQGPPVPPRDPSPAQPRLGDTRHKVVVEGCIRDSRLKIDRSRPSPLLAALEATEFVLEGPKELLQRIKSEHGDHQDEIHGVAIVPASRTEQVDVGSTPIGDKTRVVIGTRAGTNERRGFNPIRLRVESLVHLADKCSVVE